jgi:hypothetical protein
LAVKTGEKFKSLKQVFEENFPILMIKIKVEKLKPY